MIRFYPSFINPYITMIKQKIGKHTIPFFKSKTLSNLWIDTEFIHQLIELYGSTQVIQNLTSLNLNDKNLIKSIFKHELILFRQIEKTDSLIEAYQISFNLKKRRQQIIDQWIQPLFYPFFLYIAAWLLLLSYIYIMLPSIKSQLPMLETQFPSSIVLFVFGIQCGLIILLSLYFLTLKPSHYARILNYRFIKHRLKLWMSFEFNYALNLFLEKGHSLMESIFFLKYHPNVLVGHLSFNIYKQLKEGNSMEDAFAYLDSNFIKIISIDQSEYTKETFNQLDHLYTLILNHRFKQLKTGIQIISYSMIGLVIILSYQLVLIPLKLLEELI